MTEGRPTVCTALQRANSTLPTLCTNQSLYPALAAYESWSWTSCLTKEGVKVDRLLGHGGLFKTKGVGQQILADAVNAPVSVMETAGEGGAWGIAVLASYLVNKEENETLEDFLDTKVFAGNQGSTLNPDPEGVEGFNMFMERYMKGLPIERAAVDSKIW